MCRVHSAGATFPQNCTLIMDMCPVVSENETLPPAISPARITFRSHQRAPKYRSSRVHHTTTRRTCSNPPSPSTLPALNIQWHTNRQQNVVGKQTDQPILKFCRDHKKNTRTQATQRRHGWDGQQCGNCGGGLVRACCCAYRHRAARTVPHSRGCENCGRDRACRRQSGHQERVIIHEAISRVYCRVRGVACVCSMRRVSSENGGDAAVASAGVAFAVAACFARQTPGGKHATPCSRSTVAHVKHLLCDTVKRVVED